MANIILSLLEQHYNNNSFLHVSASLVNMRWHTINKLPVLPGRALKVYVAELVRFGTTKLLGTPDSI